MKLRLAVMIGFILTSAYVNAKNMLQKFDKAAYYEAIASKSLAIVNNELDVLQSLSGNEKEALEGGLLMKKAGLVKLPKEKLKYFKAGRIKLETAIQADKDNVEYRFLRLIIEEHAPRIVKYKADISTDAQLIKKEYKNLSPAVQHAILDYSKSSKALQQEGL